LFVPEKRELGGQRKQSYQFQRIQAVPEQRRKSFGGCDAGPRFYKHFFTFINKALSSLLFAFLFDNFAGLA
jgi:hypothetical protein